MILFMNYLMVVQIVYTNVKYYGHYIYKSMKDDLVTIRKKKLEKLKITHMNGGTKMDNMPNSPVEINDADLDNYINRYDTLVVDCWAPWCGPCRMVSPIIDDLAQELQGKIVFGKLNVDDNQSTTTKYRIMSIPSLLVFKNGQLVDKIVGALPKNQLKEKLNTYM
jgi:thioredoxin 1